MSVESLSVQAYINICEVCCPTCIPESLSIQVYIWSFDVQLVAAQPWHQQAQCQSRTIYSTSKTLHYFCWVTFNSCIYLGLWNSSIYPGLCITSSSSMCAKFTVWLVSMNHFQLNNIFNIPNCIISVESLSISAYILVCECASTMTLHRLIAAEWRIYASANLPASVEIMACRLVCAKPLSEPVL